MSLEERARLEQLLERHSRTAQQLEARLAGSRTPLHVLSELEYERICIEAVQRQLRPPGAPAPASGDLQFVNQIDALSAVLNQPQANNFVIDAPAGYGKTRLLNELAIRLVQSGWYVRFISLHSANAHSQAPAAAIDTIARHFDVDISGGRKRPGERSPSGCAS